MAVDRRELERRQRAALRALIDVVGRANSFYAPRLAAAGLTGELELADLARLAPTTKAELCADQAAHPPYGSNLSFPIERYTRLHQTSGSTGAPLRWLDTPESWGRLLDDWRDIYAAAGVGAGDRLFAAFSFGPFLGFWGAFDGAQRIGCLCIPGGGLSSRARLAAMVDNQVTALCCTPTYALHLGELAAELGLRVPLRALIVAGEPGAAIPSTRRRLEAAWPGARVVDHHGMTEVGPASVECPRRPGVLHLLESSLYAEVVDPATGAPARPGELGELWLTTLGRVASPVLRYRTGDLVRAPVDEPCPCGRIDRALVGGITGRLDDMVVVRGVNVFPSAVEAVVRGFAEVIEFQVRVDAGGALTELAVDVELAPGSAAALPDRVAAALRDALGLRVPVRAVDGLPRFEHKARRWEITRS